MIAFYPIKPVYINRILQGEKKYELRRKLPRNKVEYVFLYATTPICKVVAYARVGSTHDECKDELWEKVARWAGIDKVDYFSYFEGIENACAIELSEVFKFNKPFHPREISEDFVVPQSFRYIEEDVFDRLKNRKTALVSLEG